MKSSPTSYVSLKVWFMKEPLKFKYIGLAEGAFKTRFHNHNTSFRDVKYSTSTELSNKYWEIKNDGKNPNVSWRILKTAGK